MAKMQSDANCQNCKEVQLFFFLPDRLKHFRSHTLDEPGDKDETDMGIYDQFYRISRYHNGPVL